MHRLVWKISYRPAFALPTILIASVVMLTVLLVSVSSTSTTRNALQSQYYEQLAHAAGDAGIAYAQACLDKNAGAPLWTDANPLQPSTGCNGVALAGVTCPDGTSTFYSGSTPDICSVTMQNNVRSSFSIMKPVLDSDGNATTIPNTGFVELIRASTGAVWRSYTQAAAQPAAVPSLCSGATTQALGWAVAELGGGASFPDSGARAVTQSAGSVNPGQTYYRKDFNVTTAGNYTINGLADGASLIYIDGSFVLQTSGATTVGTTTIHLDPGCHYVYAIVTNGAILPSATSLKFSLTLAGTSIPLLVSNSSWRVSAGASVHYSSPNYFQSSNWSPVREIQSWKATSPIWGAVSPAWNTTSGDESAYWISTTHSYTSTATYPANSTTIFRLQYDIPISVATTVKLSYACDDSCNIYLDGNAVASANVGPTVLQTSTITLTAGSHRFGVSLTNGNAGPSAFLFAAVASDGTVLASSNDGTWYAANTWYATDPNPYSYDANFQTNPSLATNPVKLLVVGGGGSGGTSSSSNGGGGGGGAGGLVYNSTYNLSPGSYSVIVGNGGSRVAGTASQGNNGSDSSFGSVVAFGGGGGGSGTPGLINNGTVGGSGGGGGYKSYTLQIGAIGVIGQGNSGGNVLSNNNGGGGGGSGGLGGNTKSGSGGSGGLGGVGTSNSILGSPNVYAAGGQGGTPPSGFADGSSYTGNGGSGVYATGGSGAGGSGIVIISYANGSMTTTPGGYYQDWSAGTPGFTTYLFYGNGTFIVNSIP